MKNKKIYIAVLIIIGILTLYLQLPLNQSDHSNNQTTKSTDSQTVSDNRIEIKNYKFIPENIKIKKGTTITWKNADVVRHDVQMDDDSKEGPRSELLKKDEEYSYTFNEIGVFSYHCTPHPFMKAQIEVIE